MDSPTLPPVSQSTDHTGLAGWFIPYDCSETFRFRLEAGSGTMLLSLTSAQQAGQPIHASGSYCEVPGLLAKVAGELSRRQSSNN